MTPEQTKEILTDDPRIGPVLRGQHWVALAGNFTISELRDIASAVEANSAGLTRKVEENGV